MGRRILNAADHSEVESLDTLRDLAREGVSMSGVLAPDADVLARLFGADE